MAATFAEAFAEQDASYAPRAPSEVRQLRAMVVALEAECAALAETLDLITHEFAPPTLHGKGDDGSSLPSVFCRCGDRVDHSRHRTAAWVRKRYGFGAT